MGQPPDLDGDDGGDDTCDQNENVIGYLHVQMMPVEQVRADAGYACCGRCFSADQDDRE